MNKPVIILNSHPIQYFAPLYQQVHREKQLSLTVWYCSDESILGKMDKGFGTEVKWDIPLLEGYDHLFLKNRSWKPSIHKGFWGLFNPSVVTKLFRQPRSVLIVHGWAYSTNIMAIVFGKLFGHTVCLRAETPLNQEFQKNRTVTRFKHLYLRFLFLFIDRFLFIGRQNRMFYEKLGVNQKKLVFVPYSVDNDRFRHIFQTTSKENARRLLGLPEGKKIILYSGKYITKKRPLDLLEAFSGLEDKTGCQLVMIGEGECRAEMEEYINSHGMLNHVLLTGFINQGQIPLYYCAADVFVMCSGLGETWGLSVNEAMNFGLPVIVSDTCGSAYDLVENDVNGTVFSTGDIPALTKALQKYISTTPAEAGKIRDSALRIIDSYSYSKIIQAIESIS